MKFTNNLIENKTKADFHQKITPKLFILSLPLIILSPIIPAIIIFAPPKTSHIFAAIITIYFSIIMLTLTISLFFSSNTSIRLIGIPVGFVIVLVGFIVCKLRLYLLLLNAFSLGEPFSLSSKTIDEMMDLLLPLMTIGIWLSILPILLYSLRLIFKSTKKKNLINAKKGQGHIKSIVDTHTRINNNRVYHIVLDIQPEIGQAFTTEKDFLIPNHIIHTITLGNIVEVLIDDKNQQDIYIQTSYGLL
jgi:hypothetical protein